MKHLDLFSGIGGFSLALDQVIQMEHIFCDNDPFCQEVLKKNFPNTKIYGDIKEITNESANIITGGFPCQPFSQAGKRRGTADDRYLWPEMFRVIQLAKPTWVIAENVGGLVTWNEGMVLEQVCTDLENEGYEVQPLIIPACAVDAPHRRDRVWFIGYAKHFRRSSTKNGKGGSKGNNNYTQGTEQVRQFKGSTLPRVQEWQKDWFEVASKLCRMDDGVPNKPHRIKALANAIVPQVAEEIMKQIYA